MVGLAVVFARPRVRDGRVERRQRGRAEDVGRGRGGRVGARQVREVAAVLAEAEDAVDGGEREPEVAEPAEVLGPEVDVGDEAPLEREEPMLAAG